MVGSPKRLDAYPDRLLECEEALEPLFQEMVAEMVAAGWTPAEIDDAIVTVHSAAQQARIENAKMETLLALIRASERARK